VRFRVVNDPPHAGGASGPPLDVVFTSLETPDLFKDGAEVVVEGRLASAGGTFHADKVLAKCPSKFEARPGSGPGA
jgi:cytochrome c-type biogenesis protein CcmE